MSSTTNTTQSHNSTSKMVSGTASNPAPFVEDGSNSDKEKSDEESIQDGINELRLKPKKKQFTVSEDTTGATTQSTQTANRTTATGATAATTGKKTLVRAVPAEQHLALASKLRANEIMTARMEQQMQQMQQQMQTMQQTKAPMIYGPLRIPEFSGVSKKQTADAWLFSAESAILADAEARGADVTDNEILHALGMFLKGDANDWYRTVRPSLHTWDDFIDAFKEHYQVFNEQIDLRIRLFEAKQKPDQTMQEFLQYREKLRLQIEENKDLDEIVQIILQVNPGVRKAMLAKAKLVTFKKNEAKDLLLAMDTAHRQSDKQKKKEEKFDSRKGNEYHKRKRDTSHKTRDTKENKSSSEVTCYNCDETGHYARDCPKPKKKKQFNKSSSSSSYSSSSLEINAISSSQSLPTQTEMFNEYIRIGKTKEKPETKCKKQVSWRTEEPIEKQVLSSTPSQESQKTPDDSTSLDPISKEENDFSFEINEVDITKGPSDKGDVNINKFSKLMKEGMKVPIQIDNLDTEGYIDSGANYSFADKEYMQNNDMLKDMVVDNITVRLANKQSGNTLGYINVKMTAFNKT